MNIFDRTPDSNKANQLIISVIFLSFQRSRLHGIFCNPLTEHARLILYNQFSLSPLERAKVSDLLRKGHLSWQSTNFFNMKMQKGNKVVSRAWTSTCLQFWWGNKQQHFTIFFLQHRLREKHYRMDNYALRRSAYYS